MLVEDVVIGVALFSGLSEHLTADFRMSSSKSKRERREDVGWRLRVGVPSVFTVGNLLSGFFAVIEAAEGGLVVACWLVALAGFLDYLDGMVARAVRGSSAFGANLDSLSDVVSFGVAPSFLLYRAGLADVHFGAFVAALPLLCSVVRLARFGELRRLSNGGKPGAYVGLPAPAMAGGIVSFLLAHRSSEWLATIVDDRLTVLLPLTLVFSFLMVSPIRFPVLPAPSARNLRRHPWRVAGLVAGILLVLVLREVGLMLAVGAYLLVGLGGALASLFRANRHDDPSNNLR